MTCASRPSSAAIRAATRAGQLTQASRSRRARREHLRSRLGPVDHLLAQALHLDARPLRLGDLVRGARLGEGGGPLRGGFGCGGRPRRGSHVARLVRIGGPRRLVSLCRLVLGWLGPARRIGSSVPLGVGLGRIEGAVRLGRETPCADRLHHRDMAHPAPARVFPQRYDHTRGTSKRVLESWS